MPSQVVPKYLLHQVATLCKREARLEPELETVTVKEMAPDFEHNIDKQLQD